MIELKNVNFKYETSEEASEENNGSLFNLNLKINDGEFVLLTGPSGCGKTTILRLINGLIPNFYEGIIEGEVLVNGNNVSKMELYDTAKIVSTVFQNPRSQFFNVDTTSELAFPCENQGMAEEEIRNRIYKTVERTKIEPLMNKSLFALSGGQKQKIACASVDVAGNQIILLDEPSANLDTESILILKEMIKLWKNDGKTVIAAEHRISYLWDLCDKTIILDKGNIIKEFDAVQMKTLTEEDLHSLKLRSPVLQNPLELVTEKSQTQTEGILLKDFYYKYKDSKTPALQFERMAIKENEITAVVGANGTGKTTFLLCLCGLLKKCKGVMEIKGVTYKRKARVKNIFMVMQDVNHQLFTESVLEEVLISMKEEDEEKAREILKKLDLQDFENRHPMSLSGGQKQRVAVACAIASERKILLFDEPTSGLDYVHMMQITKLLKELKEMGRTVIVVTHDAELIKACNAEVVEIQNLK